MKVLIIDVVCGVKSVGRICTDLADALTAEGHEVKIAYGRDNVPGKYEKYALRVGSDACVRLSALQSRVIDNAGFANKAETARFIEQIKDFDPDVIHLHVLHGYWLNVELLFEYLRTCGKKIVWTFHDCWAFTGHCAYFDYVGCDRWISQCCACPAKKEYPASLLLDRSKKNYLRKRELFTGIPNMSIVTPSAWLAEYVKRSFMGEYPVEVIHNGIDCSVFQRTPEVLALSDELRTKYNLTGKKVVVALSTSWDRRKGLPEYLKLADSLGEDYRVVIIGLPRDKIASLPDNVTGVPKTNSTAELAAFYVMAHAYVNASFEENYPTTNLEAISCGTPVITYDCGGSGESAALYGRTVPKGDIAALADAVRHARENIRHIKPSPSPECFSTLGYKAMTDKYLERLLNEENIV